MWKQATLTALSFGVVPWFVLPAVRKGGPVTDNHQTWAVTRSSQGYPEEVQDMARRVLQHQEGSERRALSEEGGHSLLMFGALELPKVANSSESPDLRVDAAAIEGSDRIHRDVLGKLEKSSKLEFSRVYITLIFFCSFFTQDRFFIFRTPKIESQREPDSMMNLKENQTR